MQVTDLLDVLVCAACHATVAPRPVDGPVSEFVCSGCGATYPVLDGVPAMLPGGHSDSVQAAFARQWRYRRERRFESQDELYHAPHDARAADCAARLRTILETAPPGAWVVDAGCGSGEMVAALARRFPALRFIGFDLTDSVHAAARAPHGHNLAYVQGDVMHPPLRPASIHAVVSLGVLHHTPDTRAAFAALAGLVVPAGAMTLWLYPHPGDLHLLPTRNRLALQAYYATRDRLFLGRAHRLPAGLLLRLLQVILLPALALPLGNLTRHSRGSRLRVYRSLVFALFDGLAPEYQDRVAIDRVRDWFAESGFAAPIAGPTAADPPHTLGSYTAVRCRDA